MEGFFMPSTNQALPIAEIMRKITRLPPVMENTDCWMLKGSIEGLVLLATTGVAAFSSENEL